MKKQKNRPIFKKKILIEGSVIFLVGPIGTFFSRLANYFEKNDIRTFKVDFPLHEYGFPKSSRLKYSDDIYRFKEFLEIIIFLCTGMYLFLISKQ